MNKVIISAIREFKSTALTRAFLFGVILFPLIILATVWTIGKTGLLEAEEPPLTGVVLIQDTSENAAIRAGMALIMSPMAQAAMASSDGLAEEQLAKVAPQLKGPMAKMMLSHFGLTSRSEATIEALPNDADISEQKKRILAEAPSENERVVAIVSVGEQTLGATDRTYDLFHAEDLDKDHIRLLKNAVGNAVRVERARRQQVNLAVLGELMQPAEANTVTVSEEGETETQTGMHIIVPAAFFMLLWISVMTGGQYLLMSTIEEKSSRVMEVILSAMSPLQLLVGKIVGQGGVGLTILLIYLAVGLVAAGQFSVLDQIPSEKLPWLILYFLMAYFFFAGLMAAVGSAVTEIREAQALMGPIMTLLMIPMILWIFILEDPNSTFSVVVSFIPPITPFAMILRMSQVGQQIPMWQIVGTTIVGVGGVVFVAWAAAKIFRIGVLMYGKPPSLITLAKWIRYA